MLDFRQIAVTNANAGFKVLMNIYLLEYNAI
jgi:hypothetical protein